MYHGRQRLRQRQRDPHSPRSRGFYDSLRGKEKRQERQRLSSNDSAYGGGGRHEQLHHHRLMTPRAQQHGRRRTNEHWAMSRNNEVLGTFDTSSCGQLERAATTTEEEGQPTGACLNTTRRLKSGTVKWHRLQEVYYHVASNSKLHNRDNYVLLNAARRRRK